MFCRLTALLSLPAVDYPAVPAVQSPYWPKVRERQGSEVVCRGGGRQAAGVGRVRRLAGRGGVVCLSEENVDQSLFSPSHSEY